MYIMFMIYFIIIVMLITILLTLIPNIEQFTSPKSSIKNFNETTEIHQNINNLKPHNSSLINHIQPSPVWIYPYTFINRKFDYILLSICHAMEKAFNNNEQLSSRNNHEWMRDYNYTTGSFIVLDKRIKNFITSIIDEINRRFNVDVPIVGFRDNISYYWINKNTIIIKLNVYKKYTFDDIKYYDGLEPNINKHLKSNFVRTLIIYIDNIDDKGRFHVKYMRFPQIDYVNDNRWDDIHYIKEFDNLFYLAKSRDKLYRMLSNAEARDIYVKKIESNINS